MGGRGAWLNPAGTGPGWGAVGRVSQTPTAEVLGTAGIQGALGFLFFLRPR